MWQYGSSASPTTPTVDGVAMTISPAGVQQVIATPARYAAMYYKVGLPTGSKTVEGYATESYCMVLGGVDQDNPINVDTYTLNSNNSTTLTLTTTVDNTWLVAGCNSAATVTGVSGSLSTLVGGGPAMAHSNGIVATGSVSGTFSHNTGFGGGNMVALTPAPVTNSGKFFLMF